MTLLKRVLLLAMAACAASAWGQSGKKEPHIGYLYPAGGRQGTVVQILAGGQRLQGVANVYVSGEGVHASVVHVFPPMRMLKQEQRKVLEGHLAALMEKRWSELPEELRQDVPPWRRFLVKGAKLPAVDAMQEDLPDHPLLMNLDNMSLRGLESVGQEILNFKKRQMNMQIAETALVEMVIDSDAVPGDRELRFGTQTGLTNPLCFQVGFLPECSEQEPNDPNVDTGLPDAPPLDLPVLVNGQIKPGDVDRFRFNAKRGQRLVMRVQARHLMPYLADAVPGWFQPVLTLYDAAGAEVASADDYRFDPDPVLLYETLEEGPYTLEIHDSVYRGRDDFVYRVSVGELPFITEVFPLGGTEASPLSASISGWNLKTEKLTLNTEANGEFLRQTALRQNSCFSNDLTYAVDVVPSCEEHEPNDTAENAQEIHAPVVLDGRIGQPGDVDVFQFEGRAGDTVVAEVFARRLLSPLDSLLRLTDASGRLLEWNDDHEDKSVGWCTHHADAYVRATLPGDGAYRLCLSDTQHHGGREFAYRLRVAPAQPGFALRVSPSSLSVPAGRMAPITVYALRKDGFDGAIELDLKDAPDGFVLNGGRIPAGKDRVRMTVTAPREPMKAPFSLSLEGHASIGDQMLTKTALPCEDLMQAFAYRHLMPAKELLAMVTPSRFRGTPVRLDGEGPVRIPANGQVQVQFQIPKLGKLQGLQLELNDPPKGISLQDTAFLPENNTLTFVLKCEGDAAKVGLTDNLIVEASAEPPSAKSETAPQTKNTRIPLGVLPAIPFEVVQP